MDAELSIIDDYYFTTAITSQSSSQSTIQMPSDARAWAF
jgi:hypothetical protein